MSIKALQEYTYWAKYARHNKAAKRRETWNEAVSRVEEMHLRKYPQIEKEIRWAFDQVRPRRVLGSQRALQFGGEPIERKNARLYNCTATYCDRMRFFQEAFWLLLCGCGVGFSVQQHHVAKLPDFHEDLSFRGGRRVFTVPDTIEGWADALGVLLATYMPHPEFGDWQGYEAVFDFSDIRKKGSVLASGVGKAPGPGPLRDSLALIRDLLDRLVGSGQTRLRSVDAYDIVMHASDAVLSGGVRRSATLCMFSLEDDDMMKAKTGNWLQDNPQRGRSNNSAVLLRNKVTWDQFYGIIDSVKQYGEPGFIWVDDLEALYNPCVEIGLYGYDEFGNSGWHFCVSGDTTLMSDVGRVRIQDVVGKKVNIWNGKKWCEVEPFATGSGRKLYRVRLSDGSHLDCTANHKWMVKDRFAKDYTEVTTDQLMSVSKYPIHTPTSDITFSGGKAEEDSYEYGYALGDCCARRADGTPRTPQFSMYGHDESLGLKCRIVSDGVNNYGTPYKNAVMDHLDKDFVFKLKYELGLPEEVFSWDRESLRKFLAGWMDADGAAAGRGFRIYGSEDKVRDLQLLFTKMGLYSSVNRHTPKGFRTNLGERQNDLWYAQVSDTGDLFSRRIDLKNLPRQEAGKGMYQCVVSVEELPGLHDTFCLTEPERHMCLFNNVMTRQCNLCEINGRKLKTRKDFEIAARAAAIIGTCQAGYTDFAYLGESTRRIVQKEALLGVSITGMMDHPEIAFDVDLQREMAELVLRVNAEIAPRIGVNLTARATCVKPSGTASCLLGTASGVHPHHAKRYLRRVQGNVTEPVLTYFKTVNPRAVESSFWKSTDEIISFCVEVEEGAKVKNDLKAVELLEHVRLTQQNWVAAGKVPERCTMPWLMHNVSNTVTVQDDEWEDVAHFIYDNRKFFAGISLLSHYGDLDYPQAPMCTVHDQTEIAQMYGPGSLLLGELISEAKKGFGRLYDACNVALGLGTKPVEPVSLAPGDDDLATYETFCVLSNNYETQVKWLADTRRMATEYFGDDLKKLTYALKEVDNWATWCELTRTYRDVDYALMVEEEDTTKPMQEWACSGGNCQML